MNGGEDRRLNGENVIHSIDRAQSYEATNSVDAAKSVDASSVLPIVKREVNTWNGSTAAEGDHGNEAEERVYGIEYHDDYIQVRLEEKRKEFDGRVGTG